MTNVVLRSEREEGASGYPRRPQSTETRNGWTEFGRSEVLVLCSYWGFIVSLTTILFRKKLSNCNGGHSCVIHKNVQVIAIPEHNFHTLTTTKTAYDMPCCQSWPDSRRKSGRLLRSATSISSIHSPSFIIACLLSLLNSPSIVF